MNAPQSKGTTCGLSGTGHRMVVFILDFDHSFGQCYCHRYRAEELGWLCVIPENLQKGPKWDSYCGTYLHLRRAF